MNITVKTWWGFFYGWDITFDQNNNFAFCVGNIKPKKTKKVMAIGLLVLSVLGHEVNWYNLDLPTILYSIFFYPYDIELFWYL